jgi:hypothetical protein
MILVLLLSFCVHFAASAACTVLSDPVESASLTAAGYNCSSGGVVCDNGSGVCHIIAISGNMYVLFFPFFF